jgi:hypothetical protein
MRTGTQVSLQLKWSLEFFDVHSDFSGWTGFIVKSSNVKCKPYHFGGFVVVCVQADRAEFYWVLHRDATAPETAIICKVSCVVYRDYRDMI